MPDSVHAEPILLKIKLVLACLAGSRFKNTLNLKGAQQLHVSYAQKQKVINAMNEPAFGKLSKAKFVRLHPRNPR
jgi:hypothetical protein